MGPGDGGQRLRIDNVVIKFESKFKIQKLENCIHP